MDIDKLDLVFSALANPVRRKILSQLRHGALTVGDLSEPLNISAPAISRHLRLLEETGLIRYEKQTQYRIYSLNEAGFIETFNYMDQYREYWNQQFDKLDEQLKRRGADDD